MDELQPDDDKDRDKKWLILIGILGLATLSLVFWLLPHGGGGGGAAKDGHATGGIPFAARPDSPAAKPIEEGSGLPLLSDQKIGLGVGGDRVGGDEDLSAAEILGVLGADVALSTADAKEFVADLKKDPDMHDAVEKFKTSGANKDVAGLLAKLGGLPQFNALLKKFKLDKKFGHGVGGGFDALGRGGGGAGAKSGAQALNEALKRYKGLDRGMGADKYVDQGLGPGGKRRRALSTRQGRSSGDPAMVDPSLNRGQWASRLAAAGTQDSKAYDFGFSLDAWAAIAAPNREVLKAIETEGHDQPGVPTPSVANCNSGTPQHPMTWCHLVSCGKGCVKCVPKYPFGGQHGTPGCGGATWDYNQDHGNVKAVCQYFGFAEDCKQACINHPPCDLWTFKEATPGKRPGDTTTDNGTGPIGADVIEDLPPGGDGTGGAGAGNGGGGGGGGCPAPCSVNAGGDCVAPCGFGTTNLPQGCRQDPSCN